MAKSMRLLVHAMALAFVHHALAQNPTIPRIPVVDDMHSEYIGEDERDGTTPAVVAAGADGADHNNSSATVGRCSDVACPSSGSVEVQFGVLAECLAGPDQHIYSSCSCADLDGNDFVSLRDFSAYQVAPVFLCLRDLVIWQGPGLGFCPQLGTIYRASVYTDHSGRKLLIGSMIAQGDHKHDRCIFQLEFPCYVAVPFPPRLLTVLEWAELSAVVDNIPPEGCQPDCTHPCVGLCCDAGLYDPCVIWHVNQDDTYCYGNGNASAYRSAIRTVAAHVAALVRDDAP